MHLLLLFKLPRTCNSCKLPYVLPSLQVLFMASESWSLCCCWFTMCWFQKECWHNNECLSACVSEHGAMRRELCRHAWKVRAYGISLLTGLFWCTESNEFGQFAQHLRKHEEQQTGNIALNVFHLTLFLKLNKKIVTTVEFYLALVPPFTASFFLRKLNCTCFERWSEKRCIEE